VGTWRWHARWHSSTLPNHSSPLLPLHAGLSKRGGRQFWCADRGGQRVLRGSGSSISPIEACWLERQIKTASHIQATPHSPVCLSLFNLGEVVARSPACGGKEEHEVPKRSSPPSGRPRDGRMLDPCRQGRRIVVMAHDRLCDPFILFETSIPAIAEALLLTARNRMPRWIIESYAPTTDETGDPETISSAARRKCRTNSEQPPDAPRPDVTTVASPGCFIRGASLPHAPRTLDLTDALTHGEVLLFAQVKLLGQSRSRRLSGHRFSHLFTP